MRLPGEDFFRVNSDTHVGEPAGRRRDLRRQRRGHRHPAEFKTDFPHVNYVTGDRMDGEMVDGLRRITNIRGRMNDVIHHKDGKITEWGNLEMVVNYAVGLGVVQSRFIQESYDQIRIQAVKDPSCPLSLPEIEKQYTAAFAPALNNEFRFVYEWMEEIPSDPNGKLRMIVNNMPDPEAESAAR